VQPLGHREGDSRRRTRRFGFASNAARLTRAKPALLAVRQVQEGHRWLLMTSVVISLLTAQLFGQTTSTSPSDGQATLRVTTRLVQVNVIVREPNGEPAANLTRDDFVLLDEGQEQQISVFAVESNRPLAKEPQPLPPRTFSNRLEQRGTPTSVTIILLDGLNTRFGDQAYARAQIIKFLHQLQPQDRVALYLLSRGLHVLHDFTGDPEPLLRALARYDGQSSPELDGAETVETASGLERFGAWLEEIKENLLDVYARDRALRTVRSLVAIANHVARLPGRKNLIWISGSFPVRIGLGGLPTPEELARDSHSFLPEVERVARALNDANLAIYPVDARGLLTPAEFGPDRGTISREAPAPSRREFGTMLELAERTGGQAFYNTNDIYGAVRRAVDDARLSYLLGYYPAHGRWNGKFREIKVRMKRPGLQVRFRRGYFALPEEPLGQEHRQAVLDAAVWNPIDATRLGLTVRALAVPAPGPGLVDLELQIDPRDITLQLHDGNWVGTLDLLMVQLSPEDRNLKGLSHQANLRLNRQSHEQVVSKGNLSLKAHLEIIPEASLLRILVRDVPSGTLGSVSIPLSQVLPGRGN